MPSFDVVSEVEMFEVKNAVDQANREVQTRYDFKGSDAKFDIQDDQITLHAEAEFQLQQMLDILTNKLTKRSIDVRALDIAEPQTANLKASQKIAVKQGLETDIAKKITKLIKESKLKVKSSIMQEKIRIDGKKRDDLQDAIQLLKDHQKQLDVPLQFNNFRD